MSVYYVRFLVCFIIIIINVEEYSSLIKEGINGCYSFVCLVGNDVALLFSVGQLLIKNATRRIAVEFWLFCVYVCFLTELASA